MAAASIYTHADYTVGLVCALPLELAAATAMLDEIHDDLPTPPLDNNIYTLGKMGTHSVVICCCPPGLYGTTSAAAAAIQMTSAFPSIRFGLMVGIGGGVPSEQADIRLGDIVVSIPTARHGGVVQFDYGKTVGDGRFQYTGMLNRPPRILLSAVSILRAYHQVENSRIPDYLSAMLIKYPRMSSFTHQGRHRDRLFEAHYDHISPNDTCDECDESRVVATRPTRDTDEPEIHYGLIGSGNTVMKHGPTRDRLARELGILCFEMEAAGLMDHFPCLVVRGICDYADSHKNKEWQKYAAATAAAYAKELLSVTPSHFIGDMLAASQMLQLNGGENLNAFSHDDYTVGLVCALPLELAAATAMLDEIHNDLPTPPLDNNTYTLGKMGTHNVVICCCPPGLYGTTSAAAAAIQMTSAFPSIRFGLTVGIGGGAPSEQADIRLGDIVVSIPTARYGGVVQFDNGRVVGDGCFEYTGMLNKPPQVLLKAVAKLQADTMLNGSQIMACISNIATEDSGISGFAYQGRHRDRLFEALYDHISPNDTCDECDESKIVPRPTRDTDEPEIHYGLIGSGNTVMKHGPTRDRLARELGILCFEMEAADLMDRFPCLVVRGICDYADSHKNKEWQKYAAATAAAYAKKILIVVPNLGQLRI